MLDWSVLGIAQISPNFGYIEPIQNEYALREWTSYRGYPLDHGRYATLEAAKAAAELIYSTRSA